MITGALFATYDLDALGWLLFERLATDAAEREIGVAASAWQGSSDERREAIWSAGAATLGLAGPIDLRMVWVAHAQRHRLRAGQRLLAATRGRRRRPLVLVTNADEGDVPEQARAAATLGRQWLCGALERDLALRLLHPSVLGLRDGGPGTTVRIATFDDAAAAALARVFVPVSAHGRALAALVQHRFAVLSGPPEMGKTAIARMIALALATDGWEVHECIRPEQVFAAWNSDRAQLFVADDAFGSTEYRPDAAEHWAREMERILRSLDDEHWLIWTSRPAPLRAGLARVHRERGAERFPQPGQVLVDAAALDRGEKALILFRHAQAAGASGTSSVRLLQAHGELLVEDQHFTPERIRRFVARGLFALDAGHANRDAVARILRAELRDPTSAMAASFDALGGDHRALLVALLDCPPGAVAERALAASARRHADGGLPRPAAELIDRLADHFLRVADTRVSWVHPSWRDLVIERLAADAGARRAFLGRAELDGMLLALSVAGGSAGTRSFPLLVEDGDWDLLTDRLVALVRELDDHDALRTLVALSAALDAVPRTGRDELEAVTDAVLATLQRRWCSVQRSSQRFVATAVTVAALVAWLELDDRVSKAHECLAVQLAWRALKPRRTDGLSDDELVQADDWLWLTEALQECLPSVLDRHFPLVGFNGDDHDRLHMVWRAARPPQGCDDDGRIALGASIHRRLSRLALPFVMPTDDAAEPDTTSVAHATATAELRPSGPPSAATGTVARILRDL